MKKWFFKTFHIVITFIHQLLQYLKQVYAHLEQQIINTTRNNRNREIKLCAKKAESLTANNYSYNRNYNL